MKTLRRTLDPFTLALLATVAFSALWPARGSAAGVIGWLSSAAIALLFFLNGVRISPQEVLGGVRHWRLHSAILTVNYVLFPVLGLATWLLTPWLLSADMYAGVLFLCVLPTTVQTCIAYTSIARGNIAGAMCSAALSNLLGVVLAPLLVALLMRAHADIGFSAVVRIAAQILLPFALGQLTRRWLGRWQRRNAAAVTLVDRGAILMVVYSAFSAAVVAGIWSRVSPGDLAVVLGTCLALLTATLAVTYRGSRALGFDRADRIAVTFCGSQKSLATGMPIAGVLFAGSGAGAVVLPLILYHQSQLLVCAAIARRLREDRPATAAEPLPV